MYLAADPTKDNKMEMKATQREKQHLHLRDTGWRRTAITLAASMMGCFCTAAASRLLGC